MRTQSYPSDITDAPWAPIEPHLPVYPGGRPRTTDLRDVVDAVFYVLRTGCQWRYLPKDFPPKSTVWRYFDEWRHNGTLEILHDLLRRKVRAAEKPYSPRTTASVDSQSVDTTSGGEQRGRDNAKNVDGRKRPIVVGNMGLLLAVLVTAASVDFFCPGGARVRSDDGRVEDQPFQVGILEGGEDGRPSALPGPPVEPLPGRPPGPEPGRQVPPRDARLGHVQDGVDEQPVVLGHPPGLPRPTRQQALDTIPIRVRDRVPVSDR